MNKKKAIYALSADPITFGHINIIQRASKIFDELVVAVGLNSHKKYSFSQTERLKMVKKILKDYSFKNTKAIKFEGLLVDFAYENNIPIIVKGVRNSNDLDYETTFRRLGEAQDLGIDAIILPASEEHTHISSSSVKMLLQEQGMIHKHVPLFIKQNLEEKINNQHIVGVTGEPGSGKTYICNEIIKLAKKMKIEVHHIELDKIGHKILEHLKEPAYLKVRKEVLEEFDLKKIDRKEIANIVFKDKQKLEKLDKIMKKPLEVRLRKELHSKKGLILIDAALLIELNLLYICNNNVLLIKTDKEVRNQRLKERGWKTSEIKKRLQNQMTFEQKKSIVKKSTKTYKHGQIWEIKNPEKLNSKIISSILEDLKIRPHPKRT